MEWIKDERSSYSWRAFITPTMQFTIVNVGEKYILQVPGNLTKTGLSVITFSSLTEAQDHAENLLQNL